MRRTLYILAALAVATFGGAAMPINDAAAQTDGLLQIDDAFHEYLERQRTLGQLPNAHLTHQPLSAYEVQAYLSTLQPDTSTHHQPPTTHHRHSPIGPFYRNGTDVFSVSTGDYALQLNPLAYLSYGTADGRPTWQNTRGLRASGHIGPYIFFEARAEEIQERPPLYEFDRFTAPRRPFVRVFGDSTGYDYQVATGIVGLRTKHFEVRFGRDRNHWGPGESSLVLSDYGPVYDQLQIRTTFWRLQYVNLFAGLADPQPFGFVPPNTIVPRKFGAFHHLSVNVTDRISIEFFESVIFGRDTTSNRDDRFDIAYLNPIILYRAVEADRGSPDNVLLGGGASWIVTPGLKLYGQGILDEFVFSELFTSKWRNRWGFIAGVHAVPLETLSIRAEASRLRPFLYTHRSSTTAYLHYLDALGHPAGPNAVDYGLFVDWSPRSRWHAALNASYTLKGQDSDGSDPRVSFDERTDDWVTFLEGARRTHFLLEAYVGYEVLPRLFAEVVLRAEHIESRISSGASYVQPYVALRWGLPFASVQY